MSTEQPPTTPRRPLRLRYPIEYYRSLPSSPSPVAQDANASNTRRQIRLFRRETRLRLAAAEEDVIQAFRSEAHEDEAHSNEACGDKTPSNNPHRNNSEAHSHGGGTGPISNEESKGLQGDNEDQGDKTPVASPTRVPTSPLTPTNSSDGMPGLRRYGAVGDFTDHAQALEAGFKAVTPPAPYTSGKDKTRSLSPSELDNERGRKRQKRGSELDSICNNSQTIIVCNSEAASASVNSSHQEDFPSTNEVPEDAAPSKFF